MMPRSQRKSSFLGRVTVALSSGQALLFLLLVTPLRRQSFCPLGRWCPVHLPAQGPLCLSAARRRDAAGYIGPPAAATISGSAPALPAGLRATAGPHRHRRLCRAGRLCRWQSPCLPCACLTVAQHRPVRRYAHHERLLPPGRYCQPPRDKTG